MKRQHTRVVPGEALKSSCKPCPILIGKHLCWNPGVETAQLCHQTWSSQKAAPQVSRILGMELGRDSANPAKDRNTPGPEIKAIGISLWAQQKLLFL